MTFEILANLAAAFVLGTLIGIERQWRQRIAGLRTNALVATGAAMFVTLPDLVPGDASPTRVAAQVVSGIGFLGAGVIIRDGLNIRGLNTAATLWCAAGVGVLAGSGFALVAAVGTVFVLAANLGLRSFARRLDTRTSNADDSTVLYTVRALCAASAEQRVRTHLITEAIGNGLRLQSVQSEDDLDSTRIEITANLICSGHNDSIIEKVVSHVSLDEAVSAVRWEVGLSTNEDARSLMEEIAATDRDRPL